MTRSHMSQPQEIRHCLCLRGGFTLMELLVVVGVIVILVATLFPAARRAADSASVSQCIGNLRQLGAGAGLYAGDNQGDWPRCLPDSEANGQSCISVTWLAGSREWEGIGKVYPYVNDKKVFFCPRNPGMKEQFLSWDWDNLPGGSQNVYGSYVLRGFQKTDFEPMGKKLGDISGRAYVSCTFLYLPGIPRIFPFSCHEFKYPVLFGDGHVSVASLPDEINKKQPPNMWSSPALQTKIFDQFDKTK
jgi:prepilin-type N-terminal cleavage/methylation domain-containing protein/prepilin-type processing-associated H-X9-DG protein